MANIETVTTNLSSNSISNDYGSLVDVGCADQIKKHSTMDKTEPSTIKHKQTQTIRDNDNSSSLCHSMSAYIIGLISLVLSVGSMACSQALGGAVSELQLNVWRFGFQFLIVLPLVLYRQCDLWVTSSKICPLLISFLPYNIINVVSFYAANSLPLNSIIGLTSSVLIICNAVLSACIKSERQLPLYFGALTMVVGLSLIEDPDFLLSGDSLPPPPQINWTSPCIKAMNVSVTRLDYTDYVEETWIGSVLIFTGGLLVCSTYHGLHSLMLRVHPVTFGFWNAAFGLCVSVPLMLTLEEPVIPSNLLCWSLLLGHAVGAGQFNLILPFCLQHLSPTVVGLMTSFRLVVLLLLQYSVLQYMQPVVLGAQELAGAGLCLAGAVLAPVWLFARRFSEKPAAAE